MNRYSLSAVIGLASAIERTILGDFSSIQFAISFLSVFYPRGTLHLLFCTSTMTKSISRGHLPRVHNPTSAVRGPGQLPHFLQCSRSTACQSRPPYIPQVLGLNCRQGVAWTLRPILEYSSLLRNERPKM